MRLQEEVVLVQRLPPGGRGLEVEHRLRREDRADQLRHEIHDARVEHPLPREPADLQIGATVRVDEAGVALERIAVGDVVVVTDGAVALDLLHEGLTDLRDLGGAEEPERTWTTPSRS